MALFRSMESGLQKSVCTKLAELTLDMRADAAARPLAAAMAYEADQLADRATADRCAQQSFRLTPMIVETLGDWGPAAQGVFKTLAGITAERTGISDSVATRQLYEAFGVLSCKGPCVCVCVC
ncbi:unnamed protein product, partial [Polarella glacialis]